MLILGQMIVFFLMIFAGALARRYKIIIPNNQEQFSSLIVNIACPCLIISSAMHAEEHMNLAHGCAARSTFRSGSTTHSLWDCRSCRACMATRRSSI